MTEDNLSYSIEDGWLNQAIKKPSPNFNSRPFLGNGGFDSAPREIFSQKSQSQVDVESTEPEISLLVIHNISLPPGEFGNGYIEDFFCNRLEIQKHPFFLEIASLEVSSHLFINRVGEVIQFVNFLDRAWHAGQSCFEGRKNCNDFSIGIELEGTDDQAYTDAQYRALASCSLAIMRTYPKISVDRIVGHEHIAPGRKTDPGRAFEWPRYRQDLEEHC